MNTTFAEQLLAYVHLKRLSPQTLARWQAWTEADQAALWEIAYELQLGENHLRDFLDWCEECTLRDGGTVTELLTRPEIRQPLTAKLGRNDKLKIVKEALRKLRYPRLSQLEDALQTAVKALDLGGRIKVSLPPSLEGDEITVVIKARNTKELSDSVRQLQQQLENGAFQRLFEQFDQV